MAKKRKSTLVNFTPTDEQITLSELGVKYFKSQMKPWFSYSGGAGTGKTSVMTLIAEKLGLQINEYICLAYTGKAVTVLLQKGLPASTIHHFIYDVKYKPVEVDGSVVYKADGNPKTAMVFELRERPRYPVKLIFVDEATMVNDGILEDLLSFEIPIIFAGDMNQLPPVFGVSSVMKHPDFVLTKIMRQAENDPIVWIAQKIINGELIPNGRYGKSLVTNELDITEKTVKHYGIILSAKNATRENLNHKIRHDILGVKSIDPLLGDKIICRQNNRVRLLGNVFLANGLVGYIDDIDYERSTNRKMIISFHPDFMDITFDNLEIDRKYIKLPWEQQKTYGMTPYEKFEYGYCITVHLSQGSQYKNVMVIDERLYDAETTRKLRYTAVTRAMDEITVITNNIRGIRP